MKSAWRQYLASRLSGLGVLIICIPLSGCDNPGQDELTKYIAEVKQRRQGEVPPLPKPLVFERFTYVPDERRDPFVIGQTPTIESLPTTNRNGPQPDARRSREPLEEFPLNELIMQGTLDMRGDRWAIIKDGEGVAHYVKKGHYLGENFGRIVNITDEKIDLKELVADGLGNWVEREATIMLQSETKK